MQPRRPARHRHRRAFVRALQLVRLKGLVTGEYQPLFDRERMYLELVRRGRAPDLEDFVVSEPLLLLERVALEPDRPGCHGPADA